MGRLETVEAVAAELAGRNASSLAELCRGRPLLTQLLTVHRNKRGAPMDYRGKPYLIEPAVNLLTARRVVWQKAVQMGGTEMLLALAFYLAGALGRIVGYVLPTYNLRDRFVQTRVDPLFARVPAYRMMLRPVAEEEVGRSRGKGGAADRKAVSSVRTKGLGRGLIMFLSANTEADFVEFSADDLIVDELDLCERGGYLPLAFDRLREAPDPHLYLVGNPRTTGRGIAWEYAGSDRRRWNHRCGRCGELQPLDWFSTIVERSDSGLWVPRDRARAADRSALLRPVCRRCRQPFDRGEPGGRWVAEKPGAGTLGYLVSRLDVLTDPLRDRIAEWKQAQGNPGRIEAFYRSVLDQPYDGGGQRMTEAMLGAAATAPPLDRSPIAERYEERTVTMGVDVGAVLNWQVDVLVRSQRITVCAGTCRTFSEVYRLLLAYRVSVCVVDQQPEVREAQRFRDRALEDGECRAQVWLCRWHPEQTGRERVARPGEEALALDLDYTGRLVTAERTQALDAALDDLASGRHRLPRDIGEVADYAEQMGAPVRTLDEHSGRAIWTEGSAPDHYRFSDTYSLIAACIARRGASWDVVDLFSRRAPPSPKDDPEPEDGVRARIRRGQPAGPPPPPFPIEPEEPEPTPEGGLLAPDPWDADYEEDPTPGGE